jgi:hypothetical protein
VQSASFEYGLKGFIRGVRHHANVRTVEISHCGVSIIKSAESRARHLGLRLNSNKGWRLLPIECRTSRHLSSMDSVCVGMGSTPNIDPSVDSSAEYLRTDAYGPLGQCGEWIYAHLLPQSTSSVTETPPFSASARAADTIRCSPVRFGINKSTVGLENRSTIKPAGQH